MKNAAGTVSNDLGRVTRDAAAAVQRLGDAWGNTARSFGNVADAAGLTALLQKIADLSDRGAGNIDRLGAAVHERGWVEGAKKWLADNEATPGTSAYEAKELRDGLDRFERLRAAQQEFDAAVVAERQAAGRDAEVAEVERRYGPDHPFTERARRARARSTDTVENARAQQAAALDKLAAIRLEPYAGDDYTDEGRRGFAAAGQSAPRAAVDVPLPRPRPVEPTLDTRRMEAEAVASAARIQAAFDAVTPRPRLEMPTIPSVRGLSSSLNGPYSDNGGVR